MMKKQKQSLRWQEIWDAEERDKDERRIKNGQQRGTGEEANGGLDEMKAKERTTWEHRIFALEKLKTRRNNELNAIYVYSKGIDV